MEITSPPIASRYCANAAGKPEESEDELSEDSDHELIRQLRGGSLSKAPGSSSFGSPHSDSGGSQTAPQIIAISSDDESDAGSGNESIELSDVEEDVPLKVCLAFFPVCFGCFEGPLHLYSPQRGHVVSNAPTGSTAERSEGHADAHVG